MKLKPIHNQAGDIVGYQFYCPGCKCGHWVRTTGNGPVWGFNGDMDRPTFTPSILSNKGQECPGMPVCHSFVIDGQIRYLSDCTHHLAGQTIPLPELNEDGEPI